MATKKKVLAEAKVALKKKQAKKETPINREVPHIDAFLNLEGRVLELEQRIDAIVVAHTKCKSLKGL